MQEKDRLESLFNRQKEFQILVGNYPFINNEHKQEYINEQSLALIVEISEALQETPWKSWKRTKEFDEQKFKEEIIDCWHFLLNLTLSTMDSDEFFQLFLIKNFKNIKRQNEGY
jgi:dimeric dUTPase (all-alpha-NTP-PPase superfamily)